MILLVGGEKGGTGKTTIATNLAVLRAAEGKDVLLVDADLQGNSNFWATCRDEAGIPPRITCVQKLGKGLAAELRALADKFDDIIVDAGGRDSAELRAGLLAAKKVYVPIRASQFDVWTLAAMEKMIDQARTFNTGLKVSAVITMASSNPQVSEVDDAKEFLADFPEMTLSAVVVRERIAYRKAARDGRAVTEIKPGDPKAAKEMEDLYREVFDVQA
jgi:chromosome partitioning protein